MESTAINVERVHEALRKVIDPELGLDVVTLGLVYEVRCADDGAVDVQMTMTSRGCPMQGIISASARSVVGALPGVTEARVEVVWEPAWTPERIEPAGRAALRL